MNRVRRAVQSCRWPQMREEQPYRGSMKTRASLAILCLAWFAASSAVTTRAHDKGWLAFFTGDACQMGRSVDDLSTPGSGIAIAILRRPFDKLPPAAGQTMLSVMLIEGGTPLKKINDSIVIIAGSKKWKLNKLTSAEHGGLGMNYLSGAAADEARSSFLADDVSVQVERPDGRSQSYAVNPKGFAVANATFNACVAALSLEKPMQ